MELTVVVITKDRPLQVKQLIDSLSNTKLPSLSLVLIDDSTQENFASTERFLRSCNIVYEHKSSFEVGRGVRATLKRRRQSKVQKSLIELCFGLKSPFTEFAKSLSKLTPFRETLLQLLSRSFGPYSTARNLGIYCSMQEFNPEKILFLDDDCYIEGSERLAAALRLIGQNMHGKEVVVVSGLYEDLLLAHRKSRHRYEELAPTSILTGMGLFLKRSFLTQQQQRLVLAPFHTLGGTLILSKRIFSTLPFDPFVPRGEDHAYGLDVKARHAKEFAIIRDNLFVIQHNSKPMETSIHEEKNVLRDIVRFIYLRFKTGQHSIPQFTFRWTVNSLAHMFLRPSKCKQRFLELWTLLFLARSYAKRNAHKYSRVVRAWQAFIKA